MYIIDINFLSVLHVTIFFQFYLSFTFVYGNFCKTKFVNFLIVMYFYAHDSRQGFNFLSFQMGNQLYLPHLLNNSPFPTEEW